MNVTELYTIFLDKQRQKEYDELKKDKSFSRGKYGLAGQLVFQTFNAIPSQSSPPINPVAGTIYIDDMDGRMFIYDGVQWIDRGNIIRRTDEEENRHRALINIMEGRA